MLTYLRVLPATPPRHRRRRPESVPARKL